MLSSHTTPLYRKQGGVEEILVAGSVRLVAYDQRRLERWSVRGSKRSACPSRRRRRMIFAMSQSMAKASSHLPPLLQEPTKTTTPSLLNERPASPARVQHPRTNKDGQLSRDEWNAYFDVFKQAESGLFAVSVPADSERGDMTLLTCCGDKSAVSQSNLAALLPGPRLYYLRWRIGVVLRAVNASLCISEAHRRRVAVLRFADRDAAGSTSPQPAVVTVLQPGDALHVLAQNDLGNRSGDARHRGRHAVRSHHRAPVRIFIQPSAEAAGDAPGAWPAQSTLAQ